jgi:hypothetical protein
MHDPQNPTVFYLSVHSDPKVYSAPFKNVVQKHALFEFSGKGRRVGKTYTAAQVIKKVSEALIACGAIPVHDENARQQYSGRPMSLFVTQLEAYWAAAISDLDRVGVRIYVMPVAGAVEGLPDPVLDAFNRYYERRLSHLLSEAQHGSDVSDLIEVACSLAGLFEDAGITLNARHRALIEQTNAMIKTVQAAASAIFVAPAQKPAPSVSLPLSVPDIDDDF